MNVQGDIISAALADADAETQAHVLNEFVSHLTVLCKHSTTGSVGTQAFYICKFLRTGTVEFLKELVNSYEYLKAEKSAEVAQLDAQIAYQRQELARLKEENQR